MRIFSALAALFFLGLIAAAGIAGWGVLEYKAPGPLASQKIVYIAPGTSTSGIYGVLAQEGVVGDGLQRYVFLAAVKTAGARLKAGEYEVPAQISMQGVIRLLDSGKTYQRQITIAEGLMSFEIVNLVNAADALEGNVTDIPAQGSLLPETYSYSRGDDRAKIITRMEKSMQQALGELWEKRDPDTLVKTPEEAVILASVVEKETGVAAERAKVAGVFMNRLRAGMPLQTDPTVIYALTEGKKKLERPLLRKDLDIVSPYNTYLNTGLPPGPIANPGRLSLEAVLHPEKHDYLYFVADGTGGHAFAATHDEHLRNVAHWRDIQR